ncbi:TPA: hypothetical protein NKY23_000002 [Vibrio parahaemolyticus]|nr:hypothetical protein [Vibrio parahaemolyticus]
MTCQLAHRYNVVLESLPKDQSPYNGRHKCAGCAYEKGFSDGFYRNPTATIDYSSLPDSQAGHGRHKSVHAAYALGYWNGIQSFYNNNEG